MSSCETLFIPGDSRIHRAHPYTKLTYILLTGVAVYCLPNVPVTGGCFIVFNTCLARACGVLKASWKVIWRTLLPVTLFMVPIHGTLYPGNLSPLICYQGVCIYREGLLFALAVLLKLLVVLEASLLFVLTTHPADLITAVSVTSGSPSLAYLIGSPLLLLPTMRQRIRTIQSAQQARGMEISGSIFKRFKGLVPLVMPLILGAIIEIEQRSVALELKGFKSGGPKNFLRRLEDSGAQRVARIVMVVLSAAIIVFRVAYP